MATCRVCGKGFFGDPDDDPRGGVHQECAAEWLEDHGPTASEVAHRLVGAALEASETLDRLWAAYWTAAKREGVEGDWRALVGPAAAFGDLRQMLGRLRGEADEEIGRGMQAERLPAAIVDGIGHVARHGRANRTRWDVDGLRVALTEVLARRIGDERAVICDSDGIVLEPAEVVKRAVARAVEETVAASGSSTPSGSWKVTRLRELGIAPEDFKSSEFGGWTVVVTRGVGVSGEVEDRAEDNYDERQG